MKIVEVGAGNCAAGSSNGTAPKQLSLHYLLTLDRLGGDYTPHMTSFALLLSLVLLLSLTLLGGRFAARAEVRS